MVDVRGRGVDGLSADRLLREVHGIAVEGSDATRLYLVVGPGDSVAAVRRLVLALAALGTPGPYALEDVPDLPAVPEQAVSPREAFFADHARVPLHEAAGRVCAEGLVTPYPPGIPLLAPGERVSEAAVRWLRSAVAGGVHVHGPDDTTMATLRVVADDFELRAERVSRGGAPTRR